MRLIVEGYNEYGVEYLEKPSSRVWKNSGMTMTSHNDSFHDEMVKAVSDRAQKMKDQEGWFAVRIIHNGKPLKEI